MPHPIDILRKLHNFPDEIIERVQELMVDEHVRKGYCIESLRPTPVVQLFISRKGLHALFISIRDVSILFHLHSMMISSLQTPLQG